MSNTYFFTPDVNHPAQNNTEYNTLSTELFKNRKLFLVDDINAESMGTLMQELMILEAESNEPIELYINSAGGQVSSGLAVYRYMTEIMHSPIYTYCIGIAVSTASLLYLAGTKRFIYEGTKIIIHDLSSMSNSCEKPSELKSRLDSLDKTKAMICDIIAGRTGHTSAEISEIIKNDKIYDADEALDFGLATEIVKKESTNKKSDSLFSFDPTANKIEESQAGASTVSGEDNVMLAGVPRSLLHLDRNDGKIPLYRFGFAYEVNNDNSVVYANVYVKVSSTTPRGTKYTIDLGAPGTQYTCTLSDNREPVTLSAEEIVHLYHENGKKYITNRLRNSVLHSR